MLRFADTSNLPTTDAEIRKLLWANHLHAAQGGCDEAAELMLAGLAWHLQQNSLSVSMRVFLSDALTRIAEAPAKDRAKAAKRHLLLGRGPGGGSKIDAERRELWRALYIWDVFGDVADADLNGAAQAASERQRDAPDPGLFKRAYLKHRQSLRDTASQGSNSE